MAKEEGGDLEGNWRAMFTKSLEFQWPSCFRMRGTETPGGQPLRVPRRIIPDPSVHDDDDGPGWTVCHRSSTSAPILNLREMNRYHLKGSVSLCPLATTRFPTMG